MRETREIYTLCKRFKERVYKAKENKQLVKLHVQEDVLKLMCITTLCNKTNKTYKLTMSSN